MSDRYFMNGRMMRDAKWQESVLNSRRKRDDGYGNGAISFLACGCGCGPSAYIQLTEEEKETRLPISSGNKWVRNSGFRNKQVEK